jgi:hypothetical protein
MNLPDVQRGMTIMAEQIQRINAAIKQVAVRPGVGYTVSQGAGGTSILINSGLLSASRTCPFRVSDASVAASGGAVTLKVEVHQDPVLGTITEAYPQGRYPYGMSSDPDAAPFVITLQQQEGWEGIYLNLLVNQYNNIDPAPTAITVSAEHEPKNGTSIYQRFLLASVFKKIAGDTLYISEIANACPAVYPRTPPACPFLVEDDSTSENARISIRSGLVANALPDGMTLSDNYSMVISTSQDYWIIYIGMIVSNGVIQTTPGSITIFAADSYQVNTPTYVYFKIAEIQAYYNIDGLRYIGWILNSCASPFVSGGGNVKCWFQCTDASEGTDLKVKVAQDQINNRWPDGMGLGFPDFILEISQSCYIYAKILFNTTTLEIETASDSITILQSNELQSNTASEQYILLATVVTATEPVRITEINNGCEQPSPNPCALAWSS